MWDSSTRGVGDGGGPVPRDLGGQLLWVSGWLNFIINAVSRNWASETGSIKEQRWFQSSLVEALG